MKRFPRAVGRMPGGSDVRHWGSAGDVRSAVGVAFGPDCRTVSAALVSAQDHGLHLQPTVIAHLGTQLPDEVVQPYRKLDAREHASLVEMQACAEQLACIAADLIEELVGLATEGPLAVAVEEPGIWTEDDDGAVTYSPLLDPAWLAERSGLNVIDSFPSRDLIQRGRGGPLATMGQWLILGARRPSRGERHVRALVELDQTIRLTYLPPQSIRYSATSPLVAFDVGPGLNLLDQVVSTLTGGKKSADVHGNLAVQGRKIPELFDTWFGDPVFQRREWHRHGVSPESLLVAARQGVSPHGWQWEDVLCTATHLLAAAVARAVRHQLPKSAPVDELFLTGRGRRNGFLLREIRACLPQVDVSTLDALGIEDAALYPASIGILAFLYMDRVPVGAMTLTGAAVPRLLGRLTPGSPANWHRLLREMARPEPPKMTLRAAV